VNTTSRRIWTEEIIKNQELTRAEVERWVSGVVIDKVPLGPSVEESLKAARTLRRNISASVRPSLQPGPYAPDTLYAFCRLLMEDCSASPELVLRDALLASEFLGLQSRAFEDYELETLRSSLIFICWRASRLLSRSQETQHWEREYLLSLRRSTDWTEQREWHLSEWWQELRPPKVRALGEEGVFRTLIRLREEAEAEPRGVAIRSIALYRCLRGPAIFASDLQSFFQGEAARLAGATLKTLGRYQDAARWLDKAEAHFLSGADPDPQLARTVFLRLSILYSLTNVEAVLQDAPALELTFSRLGMEDDRVKCRILWATSLKIAGRPEAALQVLDSVRDVRPEVSPRLYGWILAEAADIEAICGDFQKGMEDLRRAAEILHREKQLTGLANLNLMFGFMCRSRGLLGEAVELFKASARDYEDLGMMANAAYARLLVAETYLAMQLPRDAEAEVLKAIPIFEEEGIVADAVAALSILRESIRQQKLDPDLLRDLRDRLRPGGS
jgi:tetratricopeptide (TPR) repeat protein